MAHPYWIIEEREFNKGTNYKGVDKTKEIQNAIFWRSSNIMRPLPPPIALRDRGKEQRLEPSVDCYHVELWPLVEGPSQPHNIQQKESYGNKYSDPLFFDSVITYPWSPGPNSTKARRLRDHINSDHKVQLSWTHSRL